MAATSYSPMPHSIEDPVTFKEALEMFRETGHHVPESTLVRRLRAKGCHTELVRGRTYASYTDLLNIHAEVVRSREV